MKLLDYFNADYIADLALVENEGTTQSIKSILQIGNLSERVEKINDERLINFIFSNHNRHRSIAKKSAAYGEDNYYLCRNEHSCIFLDFNYVRYDIN